MDKHTNAAAGPSQPLHRPILSYAPSVATPRPPTNGPPSRPEWVAAGFNPSAPYPQPAAASSTAYTGPPAAGRPVIPAKRGRGRPPGVRNHTNGSPFYPTSNPASSKTPSMSPAPPPPLPKFDIAEWVTPELIQASKEFAASVATPDAPGFDPTKPLVCGTCGLGFPRVPFFKRDRQPSGKYECMYCRRPSTEAKRVAAVNKETKLALVGAIRKAHEALSNQAVTPQQMVRHPTGDTVHLAGPSARAYSGPATSMSRTGSAQSPIDISAQPPFQRIPDVTAPQLSVPLVSVSTQPTGAPKAPGPTLVPAFTSAAAVPAASTKTAISLAAPTPLNPAGQKPSSATIAPPPSASPAIPESSVAMGPIVPTASLHQPSIVTAAVTSTESKFPTTSTGGTTAVTPATPAPPSIAMSKEKVGAIQPKPSAPVPNAMDRVAEAKLTQAETPPTAAVAPTLPSLTKENPPTSSVAEPSSAKQSAPGWQPVQSAFRPIPPNPAGPQQWTSTPPPAMTKFTAGPPRPPVQQQHGQPAKGVASPLTSVTAVSADVNGDATSLLPSGSKAMTSTDRSASPIHTSPTSRAGDSVQQSTQENDFMPNGLLSPIAAKEGSTSRAVGRTEAPQNTANPVPAQQRPPSPVKPAVLASNHHQQSAAAYQPSGPPPSVQHSKYCVDPREMVLPSLYYRYEPARTLEWFRLTFAPGDRAYSMKQSSIWQEYIDLFGDSPVRPLEAPRLFAHMREAFPSTVIGKAVDGSFRVFGLGRSDKRDSRVRSLRGLYEGRVKADGQRRKDIVRADHETGFELAPKAMLGDIPRGKGVSGASKLVKTNGAIPRRLDGGAGPGASPVVKKVVSKVAGTAAEAAAGQYNGEWSMFSDKTWPPNLRLTNADMRMRRFPGQPLQHLLYTPLSIHMRFPHPPTPPPPPTAVKRKRPVEDQGQGTPRKRTVDASRTPQHASQPSFQPLQIAPYPPQRPFDPPRVAQPPAPHATHHAAPSQGSLADGAHDVPRNRWAEVLTPGSFHPERADAIRSGSSFQQGNGDHLTLFSQR